MEDFQTVAIAGAGTMGAGIAQVAAMHGHRVILADTRPESLDRAKTTISDSLEKLISKGKLKGTAESVLAGITFTQEPVDCRSASLIIEAIIEDPEVKSELFGKLEQVCGEETIFATNTSSLSVTALASSIKNSGNFIGIHFFNPAPLMPLVEIIPGIQTSNATLERIRSLIDAWGKTTVVAKDTPGFIVNRVARPFYGEAIRIYEEGIADFATIDWAVKTFGGFRMGPFELMDYIGNDVNYTVTETVFREFFYDPRYKPSFTQKRMVEAGYLGRKTGRGYYDYRENKPPEPEKNEKLGIEITDRILVMLFNEAIDALYLNIASRDDLDKAMTKGVNYPKGLLRWADETGLQLVQKKLESLQDLYAEDRYRPSVLLKKMVLNKLNFYDNKDVIA